MRKVLLTIILAIAPLLAKAIPPDDLQPFYPSPYLNQGWAYGFDCIWSWGNKDIYIGACHYRASVNDNNGLAGWAEVHWRASDLEPISAIPCVVHPAHGGNADQSTDFRRPFCSMPLHYKVK